MGCISIESHKQNTNALQVLFAMQFERFRCNCFPFIFRSAMGTSVYDFGAQCVTNKCEPHGNTLVEIASNREKYQHWCCIHKTLVFVCSGGSVRITLATCLRMVSKRASGKELLQRNVLSLAIQNTDRSPM